MAEPRELDAKLEALRRTYAESLAAKADGIRAAARSLAEEGAGDAASVATMREVRALAHKIAGSAGTFGFSAVGETAAEIESHCDRLVEEGRAPSAGDLALLTRLIGTLERAAACR